jgi:hypothetical protein
VKPRASLLIVARGPTEPHELRRPGPAALTNLQRYLIAGHGAKRDHGASLAAASRVDPLPGAGCIKQSGAPEHAHVHARALPGGHVLSVVSTTAISAHVSPSEKGLKGAKRKKKEGVSVTLASVKSLVFSVNSAFPSLLSTIFWHKTIGNTSMPTCVLHCLDHSRKCRIARVTHTASPYTWNHWLSHTLAVGQSTLGLLLCKRVQAHN